MCVRVCVCVCVRSGPIRWSRAHGGRRYTPTVAGASAGVCTTLRPPVAIGLGCFVVCLCSRARPGAFIGKCSHRSLLRSICSVVAQQISFDKVPAVCPKDRKTTKRALDQKHSRSSTTTINEQRHPSKWMKHESPITRHVVLHNQLKQTTITMKRTNRRSCTNNI